MRELDVLLKAFLDTGYETLGSDDKQRFEALLDLPDPELCAYLVGRDEPTDPQLGRLIGRIRTSLHP